MLVGFCDDEGSCVISLNWSVKVTLASHVNRLYPHILLLLIAWKLTSTHYFQLELDEAATVIT